ncbi:MAG: metallophosphoesterase family protein [Rhodospirillales bacterium]
MTPVRDLGTIDRPLFVFGGPYSNLAATEAVLAIARERGFAASQVVCTGDVVAYCAHPSETVRAIRNAGIHVVMGNCEESVGSALDDCGCGFEEGSACDVLSRSWFAFTNERIGEDDRAWMRTLPRQIRATIDGRRISFVHGHTDDISGWVFASAPAAEKMRHLDSLGADVVIGGHCGLPFLDDLGGGRLWLNAGVVGMPANDGTPRGWFAILKPQADGGLGVSIEALSYDNAAEIAAMTAAGLPDGYRDGLASGLWPNMDVLPPAERQAQGRALVPVRRRFSPLTAAA